MCSAFSTAATVLAVLSINLRADCQIGLMSSLLIKQVFHFTNACTIALSAPNCWVLSSKTLCMNTCFSNTKTNRKQCTTSPSAAGWGHARFAPSLPQYRYLTQGLCLVMSCICSLFWRSCCYTTDCEQSPLLVVPQTVLSCFSEPLLSGSQAILVGYWRVVRCGAVRGFVVHLFHVGFSFAMASFHVSKS